MISCSGLTNTVAPTLFFEFVGTRNHVDEQIETVKWCTDEYNGISPNCQTPQRLVI